MKKIIKIFLCFLITSLFLTSCSNIETNKYDLYDEIEVGQNLPPVKTKYLGLGDLYKKPTPNSIKEKYEKEGKYNIDYYSTIDDSKYFIVMREHNSHDLTIEEFLKIKSQQLSLSQNSFRVGESETYKNDSFSIIDGYYVDLIFFPDGSTILTQNCIFLDGNDIVYWEFGNKCFKARAGYEGVNVRVPIDNQPQIFEDKFSWNNVRYTYSDLSEISTIILMSTENDIDTVLNKVQKENSSQIVKSQINGMDCYILEDDRIRYGEINYDRARQYIIENNGLVSVITFCDPQGVKSYCFDALAKGITLPNS